MIQLDALGVGATARGSPDSRRTPASGGRLDHNAGKAGEDDRDALGAMQVSLVAGSLRGRTSAPDDAGLLM